MKVSPLDLTLLKHLLSSKKNALDFLHDADEKVFSPDSWRFVKIVLDHLRAYKEVPTRRIINEQIKKNESLTKYVNTLWDSVEQATCDEREYKHDLAKIKNRFTEQLISNLRDGLIDASGNIDLQKGISEITAAASHIKSINAPKAYEQKTLKESLSDIRNRYVAKQKDPDFNAGLKTGINFFDELTGGMYKSEYLIIVGPTAGGKSILLSQIAQSMWLGGNSIDMESNFKRGCDVVYFSLEMPLEQCQERLCANLAKVPQIGIREATLDETQKKRMGQALRFIEKYPYELTIVDAPRNMSMASMELVYNDITERKGKKPEVVIVDYLALMSNDNKDEADWLVQGSNSEALAEFGRTKEINVITAAQMTDDDKSKPGTGSIGTHRMSRSRMVGHNANFIMMIEKRANEVQRPDFILHLVKSRRSALTTGTLYKNLECCALLNEMPDALNSNAIDVNMDIDGMITA